MRKAVGVLLVVLCAICIMHGPREAVAALGVDFSQSVDYENGSALGSYPVVGWSFTPTTNLYLTALGLWDQDVEKRHSENHLVGIWDANQNLLGSVSIAEPAGSPHNTVTGAYGAQYHFANLNTALLLTQGSVYYVGATLYAQPGDYDAFASFDSGAYFNQYITFLGNAYQTSSTNQLVFPGQVDTYSNYLFGANIDVTPVPVPAAIWLFGSGLAGVFLAKRRNR